MRALIVVAGLAVGSCLQLTSGPSDDLMPTFAFSEHMFISGQGLRTASHPYLEFRAEMLRPLQGHPKRRGNESEATFSLTCCFASEASHVRFLEQLPRRSAARPYLVFSHGLDMTDAQDRARAQRAIDARDDVLYMAFDLRDHLVADDHAQKLPGVTLAPPKFFAGEPADPLRPARFFLTFRGSKREGRHNSSQGRAVVQKIAGRVKRDGVVLEFVEPFHDALFHGVPDADKRRFEELLNTSYALMLRGDGRWSYRFSEAVGACTVPVLLADGRGAGMTLPYEELIDWSGATAQLGEVLGLPDEPQLLRHLEEKPEVLSDSLPMNPGVIKKMRRRVCDINKKYFETPEKRAVAALKSAAVLIQNKTHAQT